MNNWFRKIMGKGVPVLIRYDAFWSYKVSKLPSSSHHSLKAANIFADLEKEKTGTFIATYSKS